MRSFILQVTAFPMHFTSKSDEGSEMGLLFPFSLAGGAMKYFLAAF